ncbi:hypothetical protein [Nocardioides sp. GY 10127]|uniref:hypothetical protein n=1 Tax=Nocardioides sp. GY 10127 TaxID=2569762 RepID=UPI0010A900EA|nr:hypothetical protein [Nocardioides sp. GY 10127]TIC78799.1 hypothetical protein E8D37_19070 [Nocardioides sp. GY 10127]
MSTDTTSRAQAIALLEAVLATPHPRLAMPAIASNHELTLAELQTILGRHGYPDTDVMRRRRAQLLAEHQAGAAEPPARPAPDPVAPPEAPAAPAPRLTLGALLAEAEDSPMARHRRAAATIRDRIDTLRADLEDYRRTHEEEEKARKEVEAARRALAAAQDRLRAASGKPPAKKSQPAAVVKPRGELIHECQNEGCDRRFDTTQGRSMHQRMKCEHRPTASAQTSTTDQEA